MKSEKKILMAFLLNISFSIFEILGGIVTNSIAIISDAIHDLGDALSIGLAFFLEKKSVQKPDDKYTFGYARYSVLGAVITNTILLTGSLIVIYNSINRIINPDFVNYDGMIIIALFGVVTNFLASYVTKDGHSLNEQTVSLHMFEDVLGWIIVLVGAILMKFTDIKILDPILSIGVSFFILIHVFKYFKEIMNIFLEKIPTGITSEEIKEHILAIADVKDVHHIHLWSIDGTNNFATMHVAVKRADNNIKKVIRNELKKHGISHVTIELELSNEVCDEKSCQVNTDKKHIHHH